MTKKEVAVQETGGIALSQDAPDWAKGGTVRGSENVGAKDIVLPRLEIVQSESPIKETDPEAREGMMFNSVTSAIIGAAAYIVPIFYRMEYLVWKDQDSGGGFFGAYDTLDEAESRMHEEVSNGEKPEDLEVIDTPVHYCLLLRPDGGCEQIVISMARSKAKVSRKWNAIIQIAGGDRFSRAYKITTFKDKNKAGKTFQNFIVAPAGFPSEAIFREAERLYQTFVTQGVKADHASAAGNRAEGASPDTDNI